MPIIKKTIAYVSVTIFSVLLLSYVAVVDFTSAKLILSLLFFYVIYWIIKRILLFKLTDTKATIGAALLLVLGFFSHQLILGPLLYYSKLTSGDFTGTSIPKPKSVYLEDHTLGHLSFIPIYRYLDGAHISRLALANPDGSITIRRQNDHRKYEDRKDTYRVVTILVLPSHLAGVPTLGYTYTSRPKNRPWSL